MKLAAALVALLFNLTIAAQDMEVPAKLPVTKEEFIQSEKEFIMAAQWLENTPLGTTPDKRKLMNAWILKWIINSPLITVELTEPMLKPFKKNPDLMIVFMAGYARFCLENSYSNDELKCTVAGMKSAVNCYNLGGILKKDGEMADLAEDAEKGKLEEWIKEEMKDELKRQKKKKED